MRILITNDDGIHSPGLDALETIAREISDDVWVVAPEYDQSGVAHSLSLNDPLRLRQVAERRFAVKGTPTDCVILGARHVMKGMRRRNCCCPASIAGTISVRTSPIPARSQARSRARCSAFPPSPCRRPIRPGSANQ